MVSHVLLAFQCRFFSQPEDDQWRSLWGLRVLTDIVVVLLYLVEIMACKDLSCCFRGFGLSARCKDGPSLLSSSHLDTSYVKGIYPGYWCQDWCHALLTKIRCEPWIFFTLETYFRCALFFSSSSSLHLRFLRHFIFCVTYLVDQKCWYFLDSGCLLAINFNLIYKIYLYYVSFLCDRVPKHVSSETFPFLPSTFLFMLIVNWCLLMKMAMWEGLIFLQLEPLQVILQNVF